MCSRLVESSQNLARERVHESGLLLSAHVWKFPIEWSVDVLCEPNGVIAVKILIFNHSNTICLHKAKQIYASECFYGATMPVILQKANLKVSPVSFSLVSFYGLLVCLLCFVLILDIELQAFILSYILSLCS